MKRPVALTRSSGRGCIFFMEPTDLTVEILKSIRDEVRKTNEQLDQTNERLESLERTTNQRFDETNERLGSLERRQVETETSLATALTSVLGALEDVKTLLRENYATTIRVHDQRIHDLESRVAAVEARLEP